MYCTKKQIYLWSNRQHYLKYWNFKVIQNAQFKILNSKFLRFNDIYEGEKKSIEDKNKINVGDWGLFWNPSRNFLR